MILTYVRFCLICFPQDCSGRYPGETGYKDPARGDVNFQQMMIEREEAEARAANPKVRRYSSIHDTFAFTAKYSLTGFPIFSVFLPFF